MSEPIVKVEGLYKKFCRNLKRSMIYSTLDVSRSMLGVPYSTDSLRKDEFWALQNINLELRRGETLGIIGINGSGKSTLLRLLTGIFPPDVGTISVKGRVGALIAVGAGFHPHMTGRENIYLNGTILGMSKKEIDQKFDEIVSFAEIDSFLEAPIATYSSGMKVRLGFSVAAHVEPEILLIDEVLSVGDISFRKKSMAKMEEIRDKSSIIFISHNMTQVERICNRVILLNRGVLHMEGTPEYVISEYYNIANNQKMDQSKTSLIVTESTGEIRNLTLKITDELYEERQSFNVDDTLLFNFQFYAEHEIENPIIGFYIVNQEGNIITEVKNISSSTNKFKKVTQGKNDFTIKLKKVSLLPNTYKIHLKWKTLKDNIAFITASGGAFTIKADRYTIKQNGMVKVPSEWYVNEPKAVQ